MGAIYILKKILKKNLVDQQNMLYLWGGGWARFLIRFYRESIHNIALEIKKVYNVYVYCISL